MLKFIPFSILMTSLLSMTYTGSSLYETTVLVKLSSAVVLGNTPVNKIRPSLKEAKPAYYNLWHLNNQGLSQKAFNYAVKGFNYLNREHLILKKNIISIVDFSKPSTQKRLFVIDVNSGKILFKTWVAHGQNSGNEYANHFSNSPESHQSSLGFLHNIGYLLWWKRVFAAAKGL